MKSGTKSKFTEQLMDLIKEFKGEAVALMFRTDPSTLSKWKNGRMDAGDRTEALCDALHLIHFRRKREIWLDETDKPAFAIAKTLAKENVEPDAKSYVVSLLREQWRASHPDEPPPVINSSNSLAPKVSAVISLSQSERESSKSKPQDGPPSPKGPRSTSPTEPHHNPDP